ncbi:manganese efflux pump [Salinimonas sp. HHU 13199]|uniref:Putative manganese efflux pump MntP n=1 Tax=Salinimonas profundi TaxID=2729140 RepID=A0ABR8LK50_9ALTE|nr:manganese efflux pump MntP family protein [Salinimonas profundi]MBD3586577.1 manganese efflux pump [Salinimonas profundi]
MNFFALLALAFAMSADAFAASLGKGATLQHPRIPNALKTGLIFGTIEGLTPIIGWLIGTAGAVFIEQWDHWVAFTLLGALGLHMIINSLKDGDDDDDSDCSSAVTQHAIGATIFTAIGTSIDAMTVGVSLAFVSVNIVLAAVLIGLATATMVTIGTLAGHRLGKYIGNKAEVFGGVTLMIVGASILYTHLS